MKLVLATHNAGKLREIQELLAPLKAEVLSAGALGLAEPEETGQTFAVNAALKSEAAAKATGFYALADDSGLCVEALGGEPGVYSARWGGEKKDFALAMVRVEQALRQKGVEPEGQKAYFICALSFTSPEGKTTCFEGRVDGKLTFPPRGLHGFGYDPIFVPDGYTQTFAEMDAAAKHALSHRARALTQFFAYAREGFEEH